MSKIGSGVKKAAAKLGLTNADQLGAKSGKVKTPKEKMKDVTRKK